MDNNSLATDLDPQTKWLICSASIKLQHFMNRLKLYSFGFLIFSPCESCCFRMKNPYSQQNFYKLPSFLSFFLYLKCNQIRKANDDERGDSNSPIVRVTRATPTLPKGVTDDTPDFNREMVMLDIPDELFGNSFTMVTNISKLFGDWLMVCISLSLLLTSIESFRFRCCFFFQMKSKF